MSDIAKRVANILFGVEAVKVKMDPPFTWVSGIKSPIYCDNRKIISYPLERKIIVDAFADIIKEKDVDVIGGTATAAIPWAAFVAYELDKPMIYIRPQKKDHGVGQQIEGNLEPGQKVLIIEDLISTGGSSIKAVNAVRDEGRCVVSDVMAIVTYEMQKSIDAFKEANCNLTTLTGFTDLISMAAESGDISAEYMEKVLEFKEDPETWAVKMGL